MSLLFSDLQEEVKRRATKDQSGTTYDNAVKTAINTSLFRIGREAPWRSLRRQSYFNTIPGYSTGTGAGTFTNGSSTITVTGAAFLTAGIKVGQRISVEGERHIIRTITGQTTLTLDTAFNGTTTVVGEYGIYGQGEYNLPIQAGHRMFLFHEYYGNPTQIFYMTAQDSITLNRTEEGIPSHYQMWGEDMVIEQVRSASVLSISSSSSADTSITVTVFGTVSGYPDYEVITTNTTNGTTASVGSKSFSSVERVVKGSPTTGRITVTANTGLTTVAVLPVGDIAAGIQYKKVQLFPLPDDTYPINVWYYKDPYRLVNDTDIHELGQEFDEAIILMATAKIKAESNQQEADRFFILSMDEIKSLKKTNVDKLDWFPQLQSRFLYWGGNIHPYLNARQVGPYYGTRSYF